MDQVHYEGRRRRPRIVHSYPMKVAELAGKALKRGSWELGHLGTIQNMYLYAVHKSI